MQLPKIGQLSIAPGVGTRSNVESPPGVWGRPGLGVGHEIDKCINSAPINPLQQQNSLVLTFPMDAIAA